ncbi:MAG: hypothetical protein WB493_03685 [Anaeromyxobacteraceae bacterium]
MTIAAWPLVVVGGARVVGQRWVAPLLLLLITPGLIVMLRGGMRSRRAFWTAAGAGGLAAAAVVVGDDRPLLAWPVIVSLALLLAFGSSLRGIPLVERIARLQVSDLTPAEVGYCRTVTAVWCAFFVLNGAAAAWLAVAGTREAWALYSGVVSYVAMGVLFAGEYVVRKVRFGRFGDGPVDRLLARVFSREARR